MLKKFINEVTSFHAIVLFFVLVVVEKSMLGVCLPVLGTSVSFAGNRLLLGWLRVKIEHKSFHCNI